VHVDIIMIGIVRVTVIVIKAQVFVPRLLGFHGSLHALSSEVPFLICLAIAIMEIDLVNLTELLAVVEVKAQAICC